MSDSSFLSEKEKKYIADIDILMFVFYLQLSLDSYGDNSDFQLLRYIVRIWQVFIFVICYLPLLALCQSYYGNNTNVILNILRQAHIFNVVFFIAQISQIIP